MAITKGTYPSQTWQNHISTDLQHLRLQTHPAIVGPHQCYPCANHGAASASEPVVATYEKYRQTMKPCSTRLSTWFLGAVCIAPLKTLDPPKGY
ncbi:hypothetical protein V6N13_090328 [Hibiscus sabdariffa]|uniref:Uncharacterized protein n=1 Tax=Hibiscus sabdariffa TaxID=183260 RepID=A0ABR2C1A3_9ROSI